MTIENGRFVSDSVDDVLDVLVSAFETNIGDSLADAEASMLRTLYYPVAEQIVELQEDAGLVLDSAQLDHASGDALGLLTALIGVNRTAAQTATGTVTFSRDAAATQDYTIPQGTRVQTEDTDPVKFETDAEVVLLNGTTSVDAAVTAVDGGQETNVAAGTITQLLSSVPGVESVTNAAATTGGADEESDSELRSRAKEAVAEGKTATERAIIRAVDAVKGVTKVQIFSNNTAADNTGSGGLPPHAFEIIADGSYDQTAVGQAILDTMAAGATPYGGANGSGITVTADLPSGQTESVSYSEPVSVQIYVEAELEVTDEYVGDEMVRNSIVSYIGGTLADGQGRNGRVEMGEEVLYGEVAYAIRDVHGVYDISSLKVDRVDPPTGESNLDLAPGESAFADATDASLVVTTVVR